MFQQQDPDQTKNTILAVVLCIGVLIAWQILYVGPRVEQERTERLRQQQAEQQLTPQQGQQPAAGVPPSSAVAPGVTPQPGLGAGIAPTSGVGRSIAANREAALNATPRVAIETPSIIGSINLVGGRVDDVTLVKYHEEPDPTSPRVVLFTPANAPDAYYAQFQWVAPTGSNVALPDETTRWQAPDGARLAPGQPVTLNWDNGAGLTFERTFAIDENYMVSVSDAVRNSGSVPVTLFPYAYIYRYGTPKIQGFFIQHEGLIGVLGEKGLQEFSYADLLEENGAQKFDQVKGGWLGFTDKYWAAALIPDQNVLYDASMRAPNRVASLTNRESFQAEYLLSGVTIPTDGTTTANHKLYVGAKEVELIQGYEANPGIQQFELLIDWGWFYFITKPLHALLNWLYGLIGNFGFAILSVTVIVKAAFFWFANKSYESMAKMKKVQPEMEKIRKRYKDDKMEQQKALMELYKKEKINPLAGCLPILIQIPVFFALYKVLFISIEMRHAPFIGWINDLSAPDPTSVFNLFGLLPHWMPDWWPVLGVWPLFMGITMWLQMQLNPQQPDPIQQQVFNWMPVLFTFLLASFPAGLVIYWAWNNVLSLGQQYIIMKRQGVDVPLLENLRKTFGAAAALPNKLLKRDKSETSG